MAGRTLPVNRSRTSLDQQRESFEKSQTLAISKAINDFEAPVKAKHVRSAIIGTFQAKGSSMFWSIVLRLPIHSNPIIAWKFCHTLHKILREGHPNVLKDSQPHREFLVDKGKFWGHFKEGYGKLIYLYCRLLVVKLDFHRRNQKFPGNLIIKDVQLESVCEHDINLYFQLSIELLDYMDEILSLQTAVFGSLDMSRSNSMTNAGQCRLAPLIPCIQDSSQVYDFIVKLLFKLHNCLPSETLEGHRIRFLKQFKGLQQFYLQSGTLQYFKTLIQVPHLGESPPNFLISSELSRHVTPVVILPDECIQPLVDDTLVQLDSDLTERNGSSSSDLLLERDRYIEHLLHQVEQLSAELNHTRAEYSLDTENLRREILSIELRLCERESEVEEAMQQKFDIEKKLRDAAQSVQVESLVQLQVDEVEKRAKGWEDKFLKLKDVYQNLRDEHIQLLRKKGDVDKKLSSAAIALEEGVKIQCELQDSLELVKTSLRHAEDEASRLQNLKDEEILQLNKEKINLQKANEELQVSVLNGNEKLKDVKKQFVQIQEEKKVLLAEALENNARLSSSSEERQELLREIEQLKEISNKLDKELAVHKTEKEATIVEILKEKDGLLALRNQFQEKCENYEVHVQNLEKQINFLTEEKVKLLTKVIESETSLEKMAEVSTELSEKLNQLTEIGKKKDEELEIVNVSNEAVLMKLTHERDQLKRSLDEMQSVIHDLLDKIKVIDQEKSCLQDKNHLLIDQIESKTAHYDSLLQERKMKSEKLFHLLLIDCCLKSEQYLGKIVTDLSKSPMITSSVQDLRGFATKEALNLLQELTKSLISYSTSNESELAAYSAIPLVFSFAQSLGNSLILGKQLAHSIPDIDKADELLEKCGGAGNVTMTFFQVLQESFQSHDVETVSLKVQDALRQLDDFVNVVSKVLEINAAEDNLGELLEDELGAMESAIEEAAIRIAKLWDDSKHSQTGVKLEVNEKVLDSCTGLMKAIVDLIKKAKILQEEIVAQGKGSSSISDFYKRNHRWTEGLLSAAKAVGFGAKLLTDAADNVVKGQGKFEQLTVASQEIAASTAQLVFASRVKAESRSKNLQALADSSRAVSSATGGVVATAKHCAGLIEDSNVLDFTHLTLHQAKRLEMDSQVKLLELESLLEKERFRLSALRKQHYQLAGELDA